MSIKRLTFLLFAEILAVNVRNNTNLGLKINISNEEKCIHISQ